MEQQFRLRSRGEYLSGNRVLSSSLRELERRHSRLFSGPSASLISRYNPTRPST